MTKPHLKAKTPINQAEIIEPEIWQKQIQQVETWQDQLRETLERDIERLDFFYIPVHVAISFLPADVLYNKIIEDMHFLRKTDFKKFKRCIQRFDKQYQKFFCTQDAEIIQFETAGGAK